MSGRSCVTFYFGFLVKRALANQNDIRSSEPAQIAYIYPWKA